MAARNRKSRSTDRFRFYGSLPTERANPASARLDVLSMPAILRLMNREDARVPRAVAVQLPRIARAAQTIAARLRVGGRLVLVGAGTSGRLCVLEAAECPPTFGTPPSLVRAIVAGGLGAVFKAREGAEDDAEDGARRVRAAARRGDVIVAVAASGVTPFVVGALAAARRAGCRTVLLTANPRPAPRAAEVVIAPAVGPEVLAGSTRLKSATAAKLVLNMLTTAAMSRLGKVYGNRLVDLRAGSVKLRERAARLVSELGGVGPERARRLLDQAGGRAKPAILMARRGLSAAQARRRLAECGGFLRAALEEI